MRGARVKAKASQPDELDGVAGPIAEHDDPDGFQGAGDAEDHHWRFGLHGKAAGWWLLLGVIGAVLIANAVLAGWSNGTRPHEVGSGTTAPPQPEARQAASVAQREFGLLSGGGWAQAWQLWSDSARATLTEADFVRLNTECRPALGVPYLIDSTTSADADTVDVTWHQGSTKGTATVVYENGSWHFVPDQRTLADYRLGADRLISDRKAAGQCR